MSYIICVVINYVLYKVYNREIFFFKIVIYDINLKVQRFKRGLIIYICQMC